MLAESNLQDSTAFVAALTALMVAVGGVVSGVVGFMKLYGELRRNTAISTIGVITGESTHQLVKNGHEGGESTCEGVDSKS
jgi:hypothetical protein